MLPLSRIQDSSEPAMMVLETASSTFLAVRDRAKLLLKPFYWSVTWLLNRILGNFQLYVGIGYEEVPPDCDAFEDWISIMATALMMFFIFGHDPVFCGVEASTRSPEAPT